MPNSWLSKNLPVGGKIQIRGGQTDGHVVQSRETISVEKYKPRLRTGSEYVAKLRAEEEAENYKSMMSRPERVDVTAGEGTSESHMHDLEELTSIGTVVNVAALTREQNIKVYDRYSQPSRSPEEHLKPIHAERKAIVGLIESNPVCVIKGPTGCGKSTQIPQFILDHYAEKKAYCNIVVTQPRRIAAITLGEHICNQRGWELGQLVGYQVGLDKKTSEDTRLLYCTTGVLLETLISEKDLNRFTHVFLDEVHEREEDMDFVMLIVKKFLRTNSSGVKVVLMSATLDVSRFAEYFATITRTQKKLSAPCYDICPKKQFDVKVFYIDSLRTLLKGTRLDFNKADPQCYEDLYNIIPLMLESFNKIDESDVALKKSSEQRAAVLIFLPGLYQIETLHSLLTLADEESKGTLNLWLCPLHSSITKDEQEKVRKYPPKGRRKIILSTNIAESSITIPDVKYVIDFCLTKHLVSDPDTGFSSLQLAWASHTNCIQREGRVGRVQDGRVYRLVSENFYVYDMDKECLPEMQRCPLEAIVLKSKKLFNNVCPLNLICTALDPPDLSNYEKTILKLKEVGALMPMCKGEYNPQDGDLTFVGLVMASLPLDIHITKLILLGHVFDVLPEAIIMGCAMSVRNIFSEPFKQRMDSYNNKLLWANSNESDPIAYLNIYERWRQVTGVGRFERTKNSEERWGQMYMIQTKHLKETAKLEEDIKRRLHSFKIEVFPDKGKPRWEKVAKALVLKIVIAGAFYPHYFSCKPQNMSVENEAMKLVAGRSPFDSVYVQDLPEPFLVYKDKLKKILSENKIGDDMEIISDGSSKRVVIEFKDHTDSKSYVGDTPYSQKIPGNIKMAVYRAVKMKQLRIPIVINCLNPREVEQELEKQKRLEKMQFQSSLSRVEYKPMIPLEVAHMELQVATVESAGHFYGHIMPEADEKLKYIIRLLNNEEGLQNFRGRPQKNSLCAAPYTIGNECLYYRGLVKDIKESNECGLMAIVFFLDYGNTEVVPIEDLRRFPEEHEDTLTNKIHPQALECVLAEVGPNIWGEHGEWSEAANEYVKRRILNQTVWAIVYSYVDKVASVNLYLRDNRRASDRAPPSFNQYLMEKGFAMEKVESYLSRENHRKRREAQEHAYTQGAFEDDDDKASVNSMSSFLSQLSFTAPSGYRAKVYLKGPVSPLEMKLFSMTHCSTQRSVQIDGNSVNSVLLDSDPNDPHERLVVSASIAQSPDGCKLTLHHTTVLPNLRGLAAIVCLLFCPTAEMRVDENLSRYTGALCGLGVIPKNSKSSEENGNSYQVAGSPMFPENDIEVTFDTNIDEEDMLNINKMRYWINDRYCTLEADDPSFDSINAVQTNIHNLVLTLLRKRRPSTRVTYSQRSHVWGLLPEELFLSPYDKSQPLLGIDKFIYTLHKGVLLNKDNDKQEVEWLYKQLVELEENLANKIRLKENKCVLCDANFDYEKLLLEHMDSIYHRELRDLLLERVRVHKPKKTPNVSQD